MVKFLRKYVGIVNSGEKKWNVTHKSLSSRQFAEFPV